jgi:hypothetical protein
VKFNREHLLVDGIAIARNDSFAFMYEGGYDGAGGDKHGPGTPDGGVGGGAGEGHISVSFNSGIKDDYGNTHWGDGTWSTPSGEERQAHESMDSVSPSNDLGIYASDSFGSGYGDNTNTGTFADYSTTISYGHRMSQDDALMMADSMFSGKNFSMTGSPDEGWSIKIDGSLDVFGLFEIESDLFGETTTFMRNKGPLNQGGVMTLANSLLGLTSPEDKVILHNIKEVASAAYSIVGVLTAPALLAQAYSTLSVMNNAKSLLDVNAPRTAASEEAKTLGKVIEVAKDALAFATIVQDMEKVIDIGNYIDYMKDMKNAATSPALKESIQQTINKFETVETFAVANIVVEVVNMALNRYAMNPVETEIVRNEKIVSIFNDGASIYDFSSPSSRGGWSFFSGGGDRDPSNIFDITKNNDQNMKKDSINIERKFNEIMSYANSRYYENFAGQLYHNIGLPAQALWIPFAVQFAFDGSMDSVINKFDTSMDNVYDTYSDYPRPSLIRLAMGSDMITTGRYT